MYLISQVFIFLAIALLIGGAIGYAFRSCLADTACDDVRADLAQTTARYEALLESQLAAETRQIVLPVREAQLAPARASASTQALVPDLAAMDRYEVEHALLAAAPGVSIRARFGVDDLTSIKGLTPKMDVWLGRNGITRYSDIAGLSASELYWLVENLPDDGASIYRDHWVAQTKALLAQA